MKIYHNIEGGNVLSTCPAISKVCRILGAEDIIYTLDKFYSKKIDIDHDPKAILICDTAHIKVGNYTTKELRGYIPNGKIIAIGGDTIWYLKGGNHGDSWGELYDTKTHHEYCYPHEIDIHLDLMDEVVDYYNSIGITAERYNWTICEDMIGLSQQLIPNFETNLKNKVYDFICLLGGASNEYRDSLQEFIHERGFSFIKNIGNRPQTVIDWYSKCWFTLGTTSPAWTQNEYVTRKGHYTLSKDWKPLRTMKGFRDWVSPFCGTVLIYDDFPDIVSRFNGGNTVPLYDYYDFNTIIQLYKKLRLDLNLYKEVLLKQQQWVLGNTIEQQMLCIFKKHHIIP